MGQINPNWYTSVGTVATTKKNRPLRTLLGTVDQEREPKRHPQQKPKKKLSPKHPGAKRPATRTDNITSNGTYMSGKLDNAQPQLSHPHQRTP